ncbi:hypothetical protein D3C72_2027100 [compost metagenome]
MKDHLLMAHGARPAHHLVEDGEPPAPARPGDHDGNLDPLLIGLEAAPPHQGAIDEDGTHAAAGQRVYPPLLIHPGPHPGGIEDGVVNQVFSQRLVVDQGQKTLCANVTKGEKFHRLVMLSQRVRGS